MVSQPLPIFKLIQTSAIIFVAVLYCLAPLQQPLADGFHKLEHAVLNTNGNHSHELAHDMDISHGHEHKLLSFFTNLLQDTTQGDEQPVKECKLDKHILQRYAVENTRIQVTSEKNYNYTIATYIVALSHVLPPPEHTFS